MTRPHYYADLDRDDKLQIEPIDMRQLAEKIVKMNYGVHRLLSHIVDMRRERLAKEILGCENSSEPWRRNMASLLRKEGDPLADEIEAMLKRGLV